MNGIPAATVERGDMLRVAWRGIGAVLVVLAIASCAVLAPAAPTRAPLDIVVGDQLLRAETSTAPGQPALDQSRAISLATADVPTAAAATGISARFVSLTVRDGDGAVALGIVARPVWLVTFVGATYDPASA